MSENATIDGYIAAQRPAIRPQLRQVCQTIRSELPDTEERISWGMPTWRKQRNLIHFAAAAHHIGIYPGAEAIAHFAPEFQARGYRFSKGAVQIPYTEPLPLDLIRRMARWCLAH